MDAPVVNDMPAGKDAGGAAATGTMDAPALESSTAIEKHRIIGVPRRRVDARAKVTGQTRFADDIFLPRMAYCKLLRSPHPHARIRKIDVSRAKAHPGVYLVLTGSDLPIEYGIIPVSEDEHLTGEALQQRAHRLHRADVHAR